MITVTLSPAAAEGLSTEEEAARTADAIAARVEKLRRLRMAGESLITAEETTPVAEMTEEEAKVAEVLSDSGAADDVVITTPAADTELSVTPVPVDRPEVSDDDVANIVEYTNNPRPPQAYEIVPHTRNPRKRLL